MDEALSAQQDHPLLRRRTSIPEAPPKLSLIPKHINSSSSTTTTTSSDDDLELLTIKPASFSYTSLRDILPASAVNSPKPPSQVLQSDSDICIRNRLVKQAAWAYLQPMSSSPSAGEGFFHRARSRAAALFDFVCRGVIRVINWMLLRIFPGSR